MKRSVCLPLAVALVLVSPSAFAASDYEEGVKELTKTIVAEAGKLQKQNLAVVDFTDLQGNVTALGRFLAEELSGSLVMAGGIQVVDRNQLNKIFKEHELSMLGISDPEAIKKVGKVAGADALITGSITEMGDSVRVTAKVMATDTARVIAAAKTTIPKTGTITELIKQGIDLPGDKVATKQMAKPLHTDTVSSKGTGLIAAEDNFEFVLQECKKKSTRITCSLSVTNLANERKFGLFGDGQYSSRLFDKNGSEYLASSVILGNQSDTAWVEQTLLPRLPTRVIVSFGNVSTDFGGIALLEIVSGNDLVVQFRDVPLAQ